MILVKKILSFLFLIITIVSLFLSLWVIIPTPTYSLLPLGVAAPEISPILLLINALALCLAIIQLPNRWLFNTCLICSVLGITISSLPLIQFTAANRQFQTEIEAVLGRDYLAQIPQDIRKKMRSTPFSFKDAIRGIPPAKVRIERDITFAKPNNVPLKLNSYRPLQIGKYPTLIIIYGGAWRSGSPSQYEQFSRYMANQGYSVIVIDYRHAPQHHFPTQLEDVTTALQYIYNHAEDLESDVNKIALLGRSAGGHLASLAAYGQPTIPIKAVVSYYSPINLTQAYYDPPTPDPIGTRKILLDFIGGEPEQFLDLYQQASPINYVKNNLPPTLLINGRRDHLVAASYGKVFYQKLKSKDNLAVFLEIPWAEHAFDAVFSGISNQIALYYTERFIGYLLYGQ